MLFEHTLSGPRCDRIPHVELDIPSCFSWLGVVRLSCVSCRPEREERRVPPVADEVGMMSLALKHQWVGRPEWLVS